MQNKNRDTEAIQAFCQKYNEYCENIKNAATQLKTIAQATEGELRDDVGKKTLERVYEFCDHLIDIVYLGEQPIQELEKRNTEMQDDMENIRRRLR